MSFNLPARRLVSQDDAAIVETPQIPRSRFTGSWTRKTTFDAGFLVPFMIDEILPGDHMAYDVTAYVRMATPLFPIFDNQRIDTFFFFVPNRLVWDKWARFMGEQENPTDSINFTIPQVNSPTGGFANNSVYDHFGIPGVGMTDAPLAYTVNALPLRAYNLIFNQWFRDQNIAVSQPVPKGDGPDPHTNYALHRRSKAHDYFTSCLPWPQKFTAPTVPMGGLAPVLGLGVNTGTPDVVSTPTAFRGTLGLDTYDNFWFADNFQRLAIEAQGSVATFPALYADLSTATGVAINTFRQAFLVQTLLERDARGGTRYVEKIKMHFGVTNPDFRLQRPEYIGGGQSPLNITPVAQTAPSPGAPVGALGAAGTAVGSHRASYAATEHGFIIGLINVRTELSYQQGLHKMWSRLTQFDHYFPATAGLGEQAVLRKEIWFTGATGSDETVFGYQERWHEYRTRYSEITGMFRSTTAGTLDQWHLAQRFITAPVLSEAFIAENPPVDRVVAAGELAEHQQYLADILIKRQAVRPIPMFGTPVTLGRF